MLVPRDPQKKTYFQKQATRICETCTFKTSSTCAYCDVCFFNRHPGLDIISRAEASTAGEGGDGGRGAKAWALTAAKKQDGWNHRRVCLFVLVIRETSRRCTTVVSGFWFGFVFAHSERERRARSRVGRGRKGKGVFCAGPDSGLFFENFGAKPSPTSPGVTMAASSKAGAASMLL